MLARRQKNYEGTLTPDPLKNTDPLAKCYMPGVPRLTYLGWPSQIIQDKQDVNFTYEWSHKKRIAPIGDTSPLPDPEGGLNLRWNGMARGRYDGNSLVVTLGNFNPYTWFDMAGNFHSDALTVVERYTPIGPDTLQYEATMTDPNVFTRPWTIRMVLQRQKEIGLLDYECTAMLDDLGIHHTFPRDFDVQQSCKGRDAGSGFRRAVDRGAPGRSGRRLHGCPPSGARRGGGTRRRRAQGGAGPSAGRADPAHCGRQT